MAAARDLTGRIAVITGATSGIGLAVAEALADRGASLRLACRSQARAAPIVDALRTRAGHTDIHAIELDLESIASAQAAAAAVLARDEPLHLLINNAGLAGQRGATRDGFELHFGVNHLGHFAFTLPLLDRLRASAPARIVHVASRNHFSAPGIDWDAMRRPTASFTGLPEYGVSKLANVLFSAELARRLAGRGVTSYAVNPGRVASQIWKRIPWPIRPLFERTMLTPAQGALSTLRAATAPELAAETGLYYDRAGIAREASGPGRDAALAGELWARSEAWLTAT